ncbi:MAG TPA: pyrimidine reductase family protein, partial [Acidimicrobiia bacterium]|nr:pyrimidine reductase family protein [Acidimicrobiia bacterium]
QGRSGALGGPADKRLFAVLRALADVILVGAGTVRAEGYGPARLDERAQDHRSRWGLASVPAIAVVTRACRLDWDAPFFTAATHRPIVVTHRRAPAAEAVRASRVADVLVAGESQVDLARAVTMLGERGFAHVLAEGGPSLNGALAGAGVLDELCLTVAPRLVAGDAKRILTGPPLTPPPELTLRSLCEEDGYLFLRYRFPAR